MTNQERFKSMASAFRQLSGHPYNSVWGKAQSLKEAAKDLISSAFSEVPNVRDDLLNRLGGLFVPTPCCASNGVFISSSSNMDAQRYFENDIVAAQGIMEDCCRELNRLAEKYK